jgi:hypothetical protein
LYVPLAISESAELFKKDKEAQYISENNYDFLEESGVINYYKNNDIFLRPSMVSSCSYDIMFASLNAETPLRYDMNYRNYMLVTNGKVIIRLFAPKATKYLYSVNDYENFEFISPVNPWNVQDKYQKDFDKMRSIDVTLVPGQMVNIPAYWWYSIKFVKSNTSVCVFKYKTYMSALSISNHLIMRMLQRQNTKRVIAKRMVSGEAMETTENNFPSIVIEGGANDAVNDAANDAVKDSSVNITASKQEPLQVV